MSIKPPCPYCKSWMNAPDYSKSRVMKTTSVSQGNGNTKTNEENSKMATKENVSEKIEKKDIIPASEPNSPFFSIRALNDKDKSKFSASQTNRGDVELSRLISTASP
ncbi:uncharacterized protein [Battus philenor]|uniref:uncharacterized protein n=1 Tax=Battus philenor TaxID=42288 RepID=UPI0035D0DE51